MATVPPSPTQPAASPALPLGWTQVSRADCCKDSSCGRHLFRPFAPGSAILEGQAIFCFCEIDPSWFQGYFVVSGRSKPLGLLAEQTDVDDCLACADGGYHEVQMKLFRKPEKTVVLENIQWTGGDLMKLEGEKIQFETVKFLSGKEAVPLVEQHFGGLVRKLRDEETEDATILDLIPEVAIVVGNMRISLPEEES